MVRFVFGAAWPALVFLSERKQGGGERTGGSVIAPWPPLCMLLAAVFAYSYTFRRTCWSHGLVFHSK